MKPAKIPDFSGLDTLDVRVSTESKTVLLFQASKAFTFCFLLDPAGARAAARALNECAAQLEGAATEQVAA